LRPVWGIAFLEYIFQVPANRLGAERFTVTQLKIMQECITLAVFTVFAGLAFHGQHVEEVTMAAAEEQVPERQSISNFESR